MLNGEPARTEARTLADLCQRLGFADARIATAVNGDFVPAGRRAERELNEDDAIEIVAPRQGG